MMILASSSSAVSLALLLAAIGFLVYSIRKQKVTGPKFKVGQTVTWLTTLQEGKIIQVREDDLLYVVEFENEEVRVLHEERLCSS
jgi:hypothetical protein